MEVGAGPCRNQLVGERELGRSRKLLIVGGVMPCVDYSGLILPAVVSGSQHGTGKTQVATPAPEVGPPDGRGPPASTAIRRRRESRRLRSERRAGRPADRFWAAQPLCLRLALPHFAWRTGLVL